MYIPIASTKVVILFIQCEECAQNARLLPQDCIDVIHLPEEEQKRRRGKKWK
jgi:UPF0176 protein